MNGAFELFILPRNIPDSMGSWLELIRVSQPSNSRKTHSKTNIIMERSTMPLVEKLTVSTGPCSMAM